MKLRFLLFKIFCLAVVGQAWCAANFQFIALNDDGDRSCPISNQIQPIQNFFSQTYTTSASGSYCVVANLTASTALSAMIVINNSQVTLDLGGFLIDGQNQARVGIVVNPSVRNVIIRNGTIANMTGAGISVSSTARNVLIEDISCVNNFNGISLGNITTTLTRCALNNCTCAFNQNIGFALNRCNGVIFNNCIASSNFQGFSLANSSNIELNSCDATFNFSEGFIGVTNVGGIYSQCSAYGNGIGFSSNGNSVHFENCVAEANNANNTTSVATGFLINGTGNSLSNCIAKQNGTGINIFGISNLVLESIVQNNSGVGILLDVASTSSEVRDSTALINAVGFEDDGVAGTNRFYTNFATNNNTANFVGITNVTVSPTPLTAINFTSNIEA